MSQLLQITDQLQKSFAMSQEDAEQIFPTLQQAVEHQQLIDLSFAGLETCSTLFLNSLLGRLYLNFGSQVDEFIHYVGIPVDDLVLNTRITKLRERALKPDAFRSILNSSLGQA
jgi:hypothetical protein